MIEQKKSNFYFLIAVVILGLFLAYKYFHSPNGRDTAPVASPVGQPAKAPVPTADLAKQESTAPTKTNSKVPVLLMPPVSEKKGLCGIPREDKSFPFLLSVYQHLKSSGSTEFAVPAFHGQCLPSEGRVGLHLVNYDFALDRAYDYLGDVDAEIKLVGKVANLEGLTLDPEFKKSMFGYASVPKALKALTQLGANQGAEIFVFRIQLKTTKAREPIGSYSYYPGIKIMNSETFTETQKKGHVSVVDLRMQKPKTEEIASAISLPIFISFRDAPILNPLQTESVYTATKADLPKIPDGNLVVLVSQSAADRTSFNAAQVFMSAGVHPLAILKDGYETFTKTETLTPKTVVGFGSESLARLSGDLASSLVIDVRFRPRPDAVTLKKARLAPIAKKEFKFYQSAVREEANLAYLDLEKIKDVAKRKKIIIIGDNDYDWRPILLFERLSKIAVDNIYWFREGFEGIKLYRDLQMLDKDFKKKVKNIASVKSKMVAKKIKKGNTEVFQKATVIDVQERKQKSFIKKRPRRQP